jgi:hypothetical protein
VLIYLSGMRPGEALTLRRGCVRRDPITQLWLLDGRMWKGATDANGTKLAEGRPRCDPWVVVEPVAEAVAVLEQLHEQPLLLPTTIVPTPQNTALAHRREGKARTTRALTADIQRFIAWINKYCIEQHRDEQIPVVAGEPPLCPSQFRRTLAWHIVRRPRGVIAGAIQYGHVQVSVTLGYSGSYASGFPDEYAFETWLLRLDQLAEADRHLRAGEHVSGPAASAYTHRIAEGVHRFTGRVLTTTRQARDLLTNPALQVHPGLGMTCVFDPGKAQCRLRAGTTDVRATPDLTDCQPGCQNIARTDRDIDRLRHKAAELEVLASDPLAPAPRAERQRRELARLHAIIADHDTTRPKGIRDRH